MDSPFSAQQIGFLRTSFHKWKKPIENDTEFYLWVEMSMQQSSVQSLKLLHPTAPAIDTRYNLYLTALKVLKQKFNFIYCSKSVNEEKKVDIYIFRYKWEPKYRFSPSRINVKKHIYNNHMKSKQTSRRLCVSWQLKSISKSEIQPQFTEKHQYKFNLAKMFSSGA